MATNTIYNLAWLREKVQDKVNFDTSAADQDFVGPSSEPNRLLDDAINEAYQVEVTEAQLEIGVDWLRESVSVTWPAAQVNLDLRTVLGNQDHQIIEIFDETNSTDGVSLWVGESMSHSQIRWRDRHTLQWGTTGPADAMTLRISYIATAEVLNTPLAEPTLIPSQYLWLVVWSACVILRDMADEAAPGRWLKQRDEWRTRFHLALAQGKIMRPGTPTIRSDSYTDSGVYRG